MNESTSSLSMSYLTKHKIKTYAHYTKKKIHRFGVFTKCIHG